MPDHRKIRNLLYVLLGISFLVRALIAVWLELGNDEVYYVNYARYPDLGHFDHPPMVGYFMQLFSFNLAFSGEFFLRLSSIIFGTVNTWLIFVICARVRDPLAGLYGALLFTASIYCFVITGIFILPDTPMLFFWLLACLLLLRALPDRELHKQSRKYLLLAGLAIGFAVISKYHALFLWVGAGLYVLLYNRSWLKAKELYLSVLLSMLVLAPVLYWNILNDFITFSYQGERVDIMGSGIRIDYFLTELSGQVFYNNPVNFVIIIMALAAAFRKKDLINRDQLQLLLLLGLPVILTFLFFSFFRRTLPHWSAPGYISLIVIAACYLAHRTEKRFRERQVFTFSRPVILTTALLGVVLVAGCLQINLGLADMGDRSAPPHELGKNDVTLDLFGWQQLGEQFHVVAEKDALSGIMPAGAPIISDYWFPAAHLDHYVAVPDERKLFAIGPLEDIHEYAWINGARGGLMEGTDAYYITTGRNYRHPGDRLGAYFELIETADTLRIIRGKQIAQYAFVFRLRNLKTLPEPVR